MSCSDLSAYSRGSQNTGKVPPVRGFAASVMQPYVKVMDEGRAVYAHLSETGCSHACVMGCAAG